MGISVELSITNLIICGILYKLAEKAYGLYTNWKNHEKTEKWKNTPKDKVILHGVPRGKDIPSISPYCLKLETYLRMTGIPYEFDGTDPFGPKGKSPWMSLNGTHISDSQFIIEYLNRKLKKDLNSHLTPEQREITRSLRIMLENHFSWAFASWRWVEGISYIDQIMEWPLVFKLFMKLQSRRMGKSLQVQGMGRHSFLERNNLAASDLRTLSVILGKRNYFGGDQPCEEDCSIFGFLANVLYASPNSPLEKMIENQYSNLKQYCLRMQKLHYEDWNDLISK